MDHLPTHLAQRPLMSSLHLLHSLAAVIITPIHSEFKKISHEHVMYDSSAYGPGRGILFCNSLKTGNSWALLLCREEP